MEMLLASLSRIEDPRIERSKEYPLVSIIFITICAVVSGANGWSAIEKFGKAKRKWLKKYIILPENKSPCDDVYSNLFKRIDNEQFSSCFINWTCQLCGIVEEDLVNIDGKTMRGSYDKSDGKAAIHMVSAWSHKNQLVLGQYKTDEKSNEITAIPALIKLLNLKGSIVTIDAMGCQKKIVETITDQEADYIIGLKGNQKSLYEEVENSFIITESQLSKDITKEHGRIETRECRVITNLKFIDEASKWKNLKSVIQVKRRREILSTQKITNETSYYISSLNKTAKEMNQLVRGHWGIENSLHWVLDVTFNEDFNRTRKGNADANFSIIRHIGLNILKLDKTKNISINLKRYNAALDDKFREKVLRL